MARIRKNVTTKTHNKAGGEAYELPTKEKFVTNLMTNLYQEEKYYGDNTSELIQMVEALTKADPIFVAKAAVYARQNMYLRTAPIAVLAHLFMSGQGTLARKVIAKVATRPDQLKDLVAYLNEVNNALPKKLHQLRKGLADVLNTFDEYQLAKYNGGNSPTLKDLILLSHPKPKNDEQGVLFKKVLDGNLQVPYTWETQLSEKGNTKEVWEGLINSGKLPYMAMLRNLKNIVEANVSASCMKVVCDMLSDSKQVLRSKQFPFRFYSAYNRLQNADGDSKAMMKALGTAIGHSVKNINDLPGITMTSADNSGSMEQTISDRSVIRMCDIANVLQAILAKGSENHIGSVFGETFKTVNVNVDNDILANATVYKNTDVGHWTNAYLIFDYLLKNKIKIDRLVLLSDMQVYGGSGYQQGDFKELFTRYRKEVNPNCWLHSIDLAGYGTAPVIGDRINLIAGWSDKVLTYISAVENGEANMVKDIMKITL